MATRPCRFWALGTCKNGNNCRFEHIGPPGGGGGSVAVGGGGRGGGQRGGRDTYEPRYEPRPPAQRFPDNNYREPSVGYGGRGPRGGGYQGGYQGGRQDDRSAYQGQSQRGGYQGAQQPRGGYQNDYEPRGGRGGRGRGGRDNRAQQPTAATPQNKYLFNAESLLADLTTERPGWVLSCYCPGTKAPVQLFGGEEREKSFEEMRLNHYMLREQGQEALAAQQQDELVQKALAQNENAVNNIEAAVQYILQGENEHPNRIDIAEKYTRGEIDPSQPPPPEIQQIIHGALPSTVTPQAPAPQAQNFDAFGRPVSQQGQNAFGGQPASTPFGQPQQNINPLAPGPFAQPQQAPQFGGGAFAAQPQQQSPFGQPQQQQNHGGAFGQPAQSTFGQQPPQQQQGAFGSAVMNGGQNPLGAFSQLQNQQATVSNPFNSANLPTPPNSFAPQAQPPQQPPQAQMPFGAHLQNQNPPAAQSSPFLQDPALQEMLSKQPLSVQQETHRVLEQAAAQPWGNGLSPITGTYINILTHLPHPGPWTDPSPYAPGSKIQHPHISLYSTRDPQTGRLTSWKNMRVEYRGDDPGMIHADGRWERIWFPDGPPEYNAETEAEPEEYTEEHEKAYMIAGATGRFPNDKIPSVPPKREWTHWCF